MCYSIMSVLRVSACVLRFTWLGVPNPMIRPCKTNKEESRREEVCNYVSLYVGMRAKHVLYMYVNANECCFIMYLCASECDRLSMNTIAAP